MNATPQENLLKRLYRFRWLIAFSISLLLHLALLGSARLEWPDMSNSPVILEAELTPLPKPVPPPPPPAKRAASPKPQAAAPRAAPSTPETNALASPSAAVRAAPEPLPFESGVDLDQSYQFEPSAVLPAPKWVETEYEVKRTGIGSGRARYRYQNDNGNYLIQSEMEASGLATLAFSGKRIEKSMGTITPQGLKPSQYRYEISNKQERFLQADFDWNAGRIFLKNSKEENSFALENGTLDVLSFLYQFMFVGPLDEMHYTITNARTVRQYEYHFIAEEKLSSKLGELNTIHIAKSSGDPDEKTEVWLASDYRYIPVKIIKIAKDGTGFEFLVTRINADFNHEHQP
jgi:hypothetical protein